MMTFLLSRAVSLLLSLPTSRQTVAQVMMLHSQMQTSSDACSRGLLNFAEADARLNGGETTAEGTAAINAIRKRANASTREDKSYSLNDICDEWSREFYFEGRRRMDLIRFNRYGGNVNYNWQWKGGTKEGRNFSKDLNIFAIPTNELTSNKNLTQNPGY